MSYSFKNALKLKKALTDESIQQSSVFSGRHRQVHEQMVNYQPRTVQDTLVKVQPVIYVPSPPLTIPAHTRDSSLENIKNYEGVLESDTASYVRGSAAEGASADATDSSEADRRFAGKIGKRRKSQGRVLDVDTLALYEWREVQVAKIPSSTKSQICTARAINLFKTM
ncbi:hypothetical protein MMC32_003942 [Xylographa parallela]|nr:hypothetical protein [Xylographa parallela]